MAASNLIRWSGPVAMAAGALLIVTFLLTEFVADGFFYLIGLVLLLLAVALPGLQARQADHSGLLGRIGFFVSLLAVAFLVVLFAVVGVAEAFFGFEPEENAVAGLILMVSFIAFMVGVILFGVATARAGVLPRLAAVLLALGFPLALAIDMLTGAFSSEEEVFPLGPIIGFPIFAAGLIWLGYALWSERGASAGQSARVR